MNGNPTHDPTPDAARQSHEHPSTGTVAPAPSTAWRPERAQMFDARRKSPAVAAILSVCPGLGQVYVGFYTRGFTHAITVGAIMALLVSGAVRRFEPLFVFFLVFFWLYNIIDAGRRAARRMIRAPASMGLHE